MTSKTISGNAEINSIRLKEQGDNPFTPASGYGQLYIKSNGVYFIDDGGAVTGPLAAAGAGSGGYTLLHDETLASPGRFDVTGTSQIYQHLLLILTSRSSVSAIGDSVYMFFNNDTTISNYHSQSHFVENAAVNSLEGITPFITVIPGNTSPANSFGTSKIFIPNYINTNYERIARGDFFYHRDIDALGLGSRMFVWEGQTAAINRLTLQPDGYATDNFAANSRLQVIGINYSA